MGSVEDLLGWRDTRWGMSASEIKEVLDGNKLKHLSDKLTINGSKAGENASYYDLVYGPLTIGSTDFDVKFIMGRSLPHDQLGAVVIQSEKWSSINKTEATTIKHIISEKFGKPERNGSSEEFRWSFRTTTITYFYILGKDNGVACIQYMPTAIAPAEHESAF